MPRSRRGAFVFPLTRRNAFALVVIALPLALTILACVDGTTPDCSDAATKCGPDLDGSSDRDSSLQLPEASRPDATSDVDVDAQDADLDAGDEI